MGWYFEVIKNYAVFNGRASRREYWMFVLVNLIVAFVLAFIDTAAGLVSAAGYGLLSGIYTLAIIVPSIAVAVRRLHDTDRSGMWYFISLVPLIGPIALLVFCVQESHVGMNQYGEFPEAA